MFVHHNELLWMLRQVDGQRVNQEKIVRKFENHGIYSLFPYFDGIESLFNKSNDKDGIIKNAVRDLESRTYHEINCPDDHLKDISYPELENVLLPILIQSIKREGFSTLKKGARVTIRLDSDVSYVMPGCEGFITEKSEGVSKVKFYSSAGRYCVNMPSREIPDDKLELLTVETLLDRHQDFSGVAQYYFNDSILRAMRSSLDSSVYSFAANLAVKFLTDEGFIKIEGDECFSVPEKIFSVLAPKLDETYRNVNLFSSHNLFSPPAERKSHVLRLELTTGCDYNRCTFCTEYSDMTPVTKSIDEFRAHTDSVVDSIDSEKSRIQRLFIGSGNSLAVETELLLEALNYASGIFSPQRISLYGRTASILEKSVDGLKRLKDAGLGMVYWGLESGSDEVLSYVCKESSRGEMIKASKLLAEAGIQASCTIIPGLGGLRLSEEHVTGTLELLHSIDINYLTFLSINPCENSLYARKMASEEDNRHLTPDEVVAQVYALLTGLKPTGLKIGMFTEEVEQLSSNTMRFNCHFTDSNKELLLVESGVGPSQIS